MGLKFCIYHPYLFKTILHYRPCIADYSHILLNITVYIDLSFHQLSKPILISSRPPTTNQSPTPSCSSSIHRLRSCLNRSPWTTIARFRHFKHAVVFKRKGRNCRVLAKWPKPTWNQWIMKHRTTPRNVTADRNLIVRFQHCSFSKQCYLINRDSRPHRCYSET